MVNNPPIPFFRRVPVHTLLFRQIHVSYPGHNKPFRRYVRDFLLPVLLPVTFQPQAHKETEEVREGKRPVRSLGVLVNVLDFQGKESREAHTDAYLTLSFHSGNSLKISGAWRPRIMVLLCGLFRFALEVVMVLNFFFEYRIAWLPAGKTVAEVPVFEFFKEGMGKTHLPRIMAYV
jgi:hypothetical protein